MDVYNKIYNKYIDNEAAIFDMITIKLCYTYNYNHNRNSSNRNYYITSLIVDSNNDNLAPLTEDIKSLNTRLSDTLYPGGWQLFYLYKEIIQKIEDILKKTSIPYYRGQSHSYPPWPVMLRKNTPNIYRENFEREYIRLCKEYPDKIEYRKIGDNKRESQLSVLQHYGLGTSLLDISRNPFIAMLFMLVSSIDRYVEPTLFVFTIPIDVDESRHLFSTVQKNEYNKRIVAQQGAFLNFDKLISNYEEPAWKDINPIPVIKIQLVFDEENHKRIVGDQLSKAKTSKSIVQDNEAKEKLDKLISSYTKDLTETGVTAIKIKCLQNIKDEMLRKLSEFGYKESDLYPDFEKQLAYISEKYKNIPTTSNTFTIPDI